VIVPSRMVECRHSKIPAMRGWKRWPATNVLCVVTFTTKIKREHHGIPFPAIGRVQAVVLAKTSSQRPRSPLMHHHLPAMQKVLRCPGTLPSNRPWN
jgi:hypothetical protein